MRLYTIAGLTDDAELFTKHEIIDSLILAREEDAFFASLPPLSPVNRGGDSSSGFLTNDGNIASSEETNVATNGYQGLNGTLRRRVTLQDFGTEIGRIPKGHSMSVGNLIDRGTIGVSHTCTKNPAEESSRRR